MTTYKIGHLTRETEEVEADRIDILDAGEHRFIQFWGPRSDGMEEVRLVLPANTISRIEAVAGTT